MIDKFKSFVSPYKESNSLESVKNLQELKNLEEVRSIFSALENQDKNNKLMFCRRMCKKTAK